MGHLITRVTAEDRENWVRRYLGDKKFDFLLSIVTVDELDDFLRKVDLDGLDMIESMYPESVINSSVVYASGDVRFMIGSKDVLSYGTDIFSKLDEAVPHLLDEEVQNPVYVWVEDGVIVLD